MSMVLASMTSWGRSFQSLMVLGRNEYCWYWVLQCSVVVYIFLVILFSFVIATISNYFQSHCFLRLFLLLYIILTSDYCNEVKIILPSQKIRKEERYLGWPWGNSSKQVRLIPMHASRHDSVTQAQPTHAHCGL